MKTLINFLKCPWIWWKNRKATNARIEELKKRDPFIYK